MSSGQCQSYHLLPTAAPPGIPPDMLYEVDQEVLLMSMPGRFRVLKVDGQVITIENDAGVRKRVFEQAVRPVPAK